MSRVRAIRVLSAACLYLALAALPGSSHFRATQKASTRYLAPPAAPLPASVRTAREPRLLRLSSQPAAPAPATRQAAASRYRLVLRPRSLNTVVAREFHPLRRRPPPSFS